MAIITDPDDLNDGTEITIDEATKTIRLQVAGNLSADGVDHQAVYSFCKDFWKSDANAIKHPFPMVAIDSDAGKYEWGTDGTNNNGWKPYDNTTRKLIRNAGWREITATGILDEEHAGIKSLGTFEDETNDTAYYQTGSDPTDTAATTDMTYSGPVNEPVQVYHQATPADTGTGFAFTTNNTLTRNDGGNWYTDGYRVGGKITILGAEDSKNNGTWKLKTVANSVDGAVTVGTSADSGTGFNFVDGGGGNDSIVRNDGESWIDEGYYVGGDVIVSNANTVANDGTYAILAVTATTIEVATASLTADTGDNTAEFDPWTNNAADTTMYAAVNNREAFSVFLRIRDADPNGKTYAKASLADAGVTTLGNRLFAFPLSNAADLDITETDANISTLTPYTEIRARYLPAAYNREVDTTTKRNFGIVIDVGTYSQSNGASATSTLFSSASLSLGAGEALADYAGGSLIIHEGTDQGTHTISGTPVDNAGTLEITLTSALTATESNLSFTMQRSTAVVATKNEIYEKVQYLLRQASDIDSTAGTVTGKTADDLLRFVGADLRAGESTPNNPNGGGSGVIIEGFDSNDTNNLYFFDNGGTSRNYPFVAAGNILANPNLTGDAAGEYTMFFQYTVSTTVTDLAISGASGNTASLDSSGGNLPTLAQNDYILLEGMTNEENNGVWQVTDAAPSTTQADIAKYDTNVTVVNEAYGSRVLKQDPIDSPDAVIVDDNSGTDIAGSISGATIPFDFDYDGNVQGGRTAATDADIEIRALGTDTAQYVPVQGTITRNTGLSFSLVAALERNYSNP